MKVDIILSYQEVNDSAIKNKIIVAIDTFRATSTIITALNYGIKTVYPVADIKQAKKLKENSSFLLAGEREGKKIPGFDLGNSPISYKVSKFNRKDLILTTTNGTKLLEQLNLADKIYIASLLNQKALAELLNQQEQDIIFCCAGNRGEFALEDFLTAGAIIEKLKLEKEDVLSDKAITAKGIYLAQQDNLSNFLKLTTSGKNLLKLGKEKDIDFILAKEYNLIPYYFKNQIEELSN